MMKNMLKRVALMVMAMTMLLTGAAAETATPSDPAPVATETPAVQEPAADVEAPLPAEMPAPSREPEATETPEAAEAPEATEIPEAAEVPAATEAPEAGETPEATEAPEAAEVPAVTEAPEAVEPPEVTEAPEATEVTPFAARVAVKLATEADELFYGDSVTLKADVKDANRAYTVRWEVFRGEMDEETSEEIWQSVGSGDTYTFTVTEENASYVYRAVLVAA